MEKRKNSITYPKKLMLILSFFGIAPVVVLSCLFFFVFRIQMIQSLKDQAEAELSFSQKSLNHLISSYIRKMQDISKDPELIEFFQTGNENSLYELNKTMFAQLRGETNDCSLFLVSAVVNAYTGTTEVPEFYRFSHTQENWGPYRVSNRQKQWYLYGNDSFFSHDVDTVLSIIMPIHEKTKIIGYIILNMKRNVLGTVFSDIPGFAYYLYDEYDYLLYTTDKTLELGFDKVPSSLSEAVVADDRLVLIDIIDGTGIYLACMVLLDSVGRASHLVIQIVLVLIPIIFFFCLLLSRYSANRISRPIIEIIKKMEKVEKGDFSQHLEVQGNDEISNLRNAFNTMVQELDELVRNVKEKQDRLRIVEIQNLRAQINPHLLYNVLDMIRWEATLGHIEQMQSIILDLSKILRVSMSNLDDVVFVRDELDYLRRYTNLQNYFYKNLDVEFAVEDDVLDCKIPKLILQPAIENCLVHGFCHHPLSPQIRISGNKEGAYLHFEVWDNGEGIQPEKMLSLNDPDNSNDRIGIYNIRKRLILCGDSQCGISFESTVGSGTKVIMRIKEMKNG